MLKTRLAGWELGRTGCEMGTGQTKTGRGGLGRLGQEREPAGLCPAGLSSKVRIPKTLSHMAEGVACSGSTGRIAGYWGLRDFPYQADKLNNYCSSTDFRLDTLAVPKKKSASCKSSSWATRSVPLSTPPFGDLRPFAAELSAGARLFRRASKPCWDWGLQMSLQSQIRPGASGSGRLMFSG
jgi:hypothetical protein